MKSLLTKMIPHRFHQNQDGTALTEFVMFLPIWIIMFIGIVSLGKIGIETTTVPVIAQQDLWTNALEATESSPAAARSPITGALQAGGVAKDLSRDLGDAAEVVVDLALGLNGHWGESYAHVVLIDSLTNIDNLTRDPEDIISDPGSGYPNNIVNDRITDVSFDGGVLASILNILSGSGVVASTAAGIRYGMATGSYEKVVKPLRGANINAESHFDVLLAPQPTDKAWPIAIARLMAEGQENYSVMMNFGEAEFESDESGDTSGFDIPEIEDPSGSDKPSSHQDDIDEHKENQASNP